MVDENIPNEKNSNGNTDNKDMPEVSDSLRNPFERVKKFNEDSSTGSQTDSASVGEANAYSTTDATSLEEPQVVVPEKPDYSPTVSEDSSASAAIGTSTNDKDEAEKAPVTDSVSGSESINLEQGFVIPEKPSYPPTNQYSENNSSGDSHPEDSIHDEKYNSMRNYSNDYKSQHQNDYNSHEDVDQNFSTDSSVNSQNDSVIDSSGNTNSNPNSQSSNPYGVQGSGSPNPYSPPSQQGQNGQQYGSQQSQQFNAQENQQNQYNPMNNNNQNVAYENPYGDFGNNSGNVGQGQGFNNVQSQPLSPGNYFNPREYGDGDNAPLNQPLYGASFMQATKRFFKKYARFSGYASRSEYWFASLFLFLVSLIPTIGFFVGIVMSGAYSSRTYSSTGVAAPEMTDGSTAGLAIFAISGILLFLFWAATIVPSLAITWRRFHDAGFSGLLYFLSFIPYIGGLIVFVFMVLPTKMESRRLDWEDNSQYSK